MQASKWQRRPVEWRGQRNHDGMNGGENVVCVHYVYVCPSNRTTEFEEESPVKT